MKKKTIAVVMTLIAGLGLSGCGNNGKVIINGKNTDEAIKASGVMKQTEFSLKDETYGLTLGGSDFINFKGKLEINESLDDKIIIKADDNVVDNFSADIDEKSKKIDVIFNSEELYSDVNAEIIIGVPINDINVSGTYDINYDNCSTENIALDFSGNCNGDIIGKFVNANITASGSSLISLNGSAENIKVSASGNTKISLCESKNLEVSASGNSGIEYSGSPEIKKNLSGNAVLNKKK